MKVNMVVQNDEIICRILRKPIEDFGGTVEFEHSGGFQRPIIKGISKENLGKAINSVFGKNSE